MIALKLSDSTNSITSSIAEVENGTALDTSIAEDNLDVSFIATLNLTGTIINDNNNGKITENDVEERFQAQCEVELKLNRKSESLILHGSND